MLQFENGSRYELYRGDCLEVMKDIPDASIDMVLCDLPYGTTQNRWDTVVNPERLWVEYKRVVKENGAIVLTATPPFSAQIAYHNLENFKYSWYWKKPHTGQLNAKRMPLKNVEECLVFYKKQPTYNPQFTYSDPYSITRKGYRGSECYGAQKDHTTVSDGKRYPMQILEFSNRGKRYHPTEKPTELLKHLILTYTNENDIVLDNTMGCGSTGVASISTGRRFIGIEIDKEYCEIAEKRIDATSGTKQINMLDAI